MASSVTAMIGVPLLSCLMYSFCSMSMVFANKGLLSAGVGLAFEFPLALLFFQSLLSVILVQSCKYGGYVHYDNFSWQVARRWLPVNLFFISMLLTSFYSLALLPVSLVTIFKNIAIVSVTIGEALVFGEKITVGVILSEILMITSAAMGACAGNIHTGRVRDDLAVAAAAGLGSTGEMSSSVSIGSATIQISLAGLLWQLLNCVATAGYVLYMRASKNIVSTQKGQREFGNVYYNHLLSLPTLFAVICLNGDLKNTFNSPLMVRADFIALALFSGVVGFALNLASFWCVNNTSGTTYSIVGAMNKIPLAVVGIILFRETVTAFSVSAICVGCLGGLCYAWVKTISSSAGQRHLSAFESLLMKEIDFTRSKFRVSKDCHNVSMV